MDEMIEVKWRSGATFSFSSEVEAQAFRERMAARGVEPKDVGPSPALSQADLDACAQELFAAPTWRERLRWKLFPTQWCQLPELTADGCIPRDVLECTTTVHLDWLDRLRVLLRGKVVVKTRTVTEHQIGANVTTSVGYPSW